MATYGEAEALLQQLNPIIGRGIINHPLVEAGIKARKAIVQAAPDTAAHTVAVKFLPDMFNREVAPSVFPYNSSLTDSDLEVGKAVFVWYYQSLSNGVVMQNATWTAGGAGGGVSSVNGMTGKVTITASDLGIAAWAQAPEKPSYAWGEIVGKPNLVLSSEIGQAGGVASLGSDGKVPISQLPSYVDDVVEYASKANFPATGDSGKIYVALDTNLTYRWGGTEYVEISPSIGLGETSSTAYPGDKGKANAEAISALQKVGGVRYDIAQSLTTAQQQQARANIGALSSADLSKYVTTDTEQTILGFKTFQYGLKVYDRITVGDGGGDYTILHGGAITWGENFVGNPNGDYTLTLPKKSGTVVVDENLKSLVTTDTEQAINAKKNFCEGIIVNGNPTITGNRDDGYQGYGILLDDGGGDVPETRIVNDGLIRTYYDWGDPVHIYFPEKEGTLLVDTDLANYVTIDTEQTISGTKTFSELVKSPKGFIASVGIGGRGNQSATLTPSSIQHYYRPNRTGSVGTTFTLMFPNKDGTGTIATVEDIDSKIEEAITTVLNTPV